MHLGCSRKLYNIRVENFKLYNKEIGHQRGLPIRELRKDHTYFDNVSSHALHQADRDYVRMKSNFLRKAKEGNFTKVNFRSKHDNNQSFRLHNVEFYLISNNHVFFRTKLFDEVFIGGIDIKNSFIPDDAKFNSLTFSFRNKSEYYISIQYETESIELPKTGNSIGLDPGVHTLLTTSNNDSYKNMKFLDDNQAKISCLQRFRDFNHTNKSSRRRRKLNCKIQKLNRQVRNRREHHYHCISKNIITNNDIICIESLSITDMFSNERHGRHFNRALQDASLGSLLNKIKYKAEFSGRDVIQVDKYFPSSQTCFSCGSLKKLKRSDRVYKCNSCGLEIDRDYNAALNIHKEGLRIKDEYVFTKKNKTKYVPEDIWN